MIHKFLQSKAYKKPPVFCHSFSRGFSFMSYLYPAVLFVINKKALDDKNLSEGKMYVFIKITDLFKIYIPHMPACSLTQLQTHCPFIGVFYQVLPFAVLSDTINILLISCASKKQLVKFILY